MLNRGEWSELYCILYLALNKKLNIINSCCEVINSNIFEVINIILNRKNSIILINSDDDNIFIKDMDKSSRTKVINKQIIDRILQHIINNISIQHNTKGAFEIPEINDFLAESGLESNIKASSYCKSDVNILNYDKIAQKEVELGYSIKSNLGSSPTLLNASNHTDFIYEIENLDPFHIEEINSINTRNKLLDRIQKIEQLGGNIKFKKVKSSIFEKNLKMVDSFMPEAIGEILLLSYKNKQKNLKELFDNSSIYTDKNIRNKKISDLLNAISFGMMPGTEWDGKNLINGGIIWVNGKDAVYLLDLIYYKEEVNKYLINSTKLDSPSSSRYKMLNLKKENNIITFTLNLQIRYK